MTSTLSGTTGHWVRPMSFFFLACLSVPLARQQTLQRPSEPIYIGILDDAREEKRGWQEGVAEHRLVMPAFERVDSEWLVETSLPASMNWTVAFDGKNLGSVESAWHPDVPGDKLRSRESRSKQSIVTPMGQVPTVGAPSRKFAGVFSFGPLKVRRPLVLVSKPYFRDPDGWRRTKISSKVSALVAAAFRKKYPTIMHCRDEELLDRQWTYPDSVLSFPDTYASNKDSFLVSVAVNSGDCGWETNPEDPQCILANQWFYIAADRSVRRIGAFADLLDAGDYDNDGVSELIFFSINSEMTDRYSLVYDNLRNSIDLEVGYN
jgi:hypothetical protein